MYFENYRLLVRIAAMHDLQISGEQRKDSLLPSNRCSVYKIIIVLNQEW